MSLPGKNVTYVEDLTAVSSDDDHSDIDDKLSDVSVGGESSDITSFASFEDE